MIYEILYEISKSMKKIFNFLIKLVLLSFLSNFCWALSLIEFQKKPKLVILIVIDQFRADYLTRFEKDFVAAKKNNVIGGFKFLMSNSAYFPFGQYDVFQNMTCPGHAMIATGARPYLNGIALNDFFDRKKNETVYCVDDDKDEVSPRRLNTTTFGDELKNADANSKVFSLALKDRSAVMLGGHRANFAFWMDYKKFQWRTSSYYAKDLPVWLNRHNEKLNQIKDKEDIYKGKKIKIFSKQGMSLKYGIDQTFLLAEETLKNEKLGLGKSVDYLGISLSSHDMLGHAVGPNSEEMRELTIYEDIRLSQFLNQLQKHIKSLENVEIVLTADHGVAPTVEYAQNAKFNSGKLDYLAIYRNINQRLDKVFGSSDKSWIKSSEALNFYFNQDVIKSKKANIVEIEKEVQSALEEQEGIHQVLVRSDLMASRFPPGELGLQVQRQFRSDTAGDFIIIPKIYFMDKDDNVTTTHMTGYSYDRTVPILFFGSKFKPGVYSQAAKVIDIAPTLSFATSVLPPAASEGQVLPIFK